MINNFSSLQSMAELSRRCCLRRISFSSCSYWLKSGSDFSSDLTEIYACYFCYTKRKVINYSKLKKQTVTYS